MNEINFAFWLKGFFELSDSNTLTAEQVSIIKKHLDLVFINITREKKEIDLSSILQKHDTGIKLC